MKITRISCKMFLSFTNNSLIIECKPKLPHNNFKISIIHSNWLPAIIRPPHVTLGVLKSQWVFPHFIHIANIKSQIIQNTKIKSKKWYNRQIPKKYRKIQRKKRRKTRIYSQPWHKNWKIHKFFMQWFFCVLGYELGELRSGYTWQTIWLSIKCASTSGLNGISPLST